MTPFFIEKNRLDPMRRMTEDYVEVVRQLAGKHRVILADTQSIFDTMLAHKPYQGVVLVCIHVHPTIYLIYDSKPRAFLQAVGYVW